MSVKSRLVMSAAALALVAGAGAAGTPTANAATAACEVQAQQASSNCVNWSAVAFGTAYIISAENNGFGLTALASASSANSREDFQQSEQGMVSDFIAAGLMTPGLAIYSNLPVYQIQYTPNGAPSGLCLGSTSTPFGPFGTVVTLQACGVSVSTTWILDPVPTISLGASALINGATDSNFQHPNALTAPGLHLPLVTKPLELGEPARLRDRQLWIPAFGIA